MSKIKQPGSPRGPFSGRARVVLSIAGSALFTLASAAAQTSPAPVPAVESSAQDAGLASGECEPSSSTEVLQAAPPEVVPPGPPATQGPPAEPSLPPASDVASEALPVEPSPPLSEAPPAEPSLPPVPPVPALLPTDIVAQSALPLHALAAGALLSEAELWARLAESPATCFGEVHDDPYQHHAQTRALEEWAARGADPARPLGVGFEMFQRPFQPALTAFMEGELDEAGLLAGTEYAARWGYDFSLYRPLLESTRELGLSALALNARAELTRQIARGGLASLTPDQLAELPELELEDPEHREYIFGLFGVLPEHGAEFGLEDVYIAQTVWDETMADTSAHWLAAEGQGARLLIFAGVVHCHASAIPRRLSRRTGLEVTAVAVALASSLPDPNDPASVPDGYDLLVVLED